MHFKAALFLLLSLLSFASPPKDIQASESGIYDYIHHDEGWPPEQMVYAQVYLKHLQSSRIFSSDVECGTGVCSRYIFTLEGKLWKLVAHFSGDYKILKTESHGTKDIQVISRAGVDTELRQLLKYNGNTYEVVR